MISLQNFTNIYKKQKYQVYKVYEYLHFEFTKFTKKQKNHSFVFETKRTYYEKCNIVPM